MTNESISERDQLLFFIHRFSHRTRVLIGDRWRFCCPAHDDQDGVAEARVEGDGLRLHCDAGCPEERIHQALVAHSEGTLGTHFRYPDEHGRLLRCKTRYAKKDGKRGYRYKHWCHETLEWVKGWGETPKDWYRLTEVLGSGPERDLHITEGEKDADTLERVGLLATSLPDGAATYGGGKESKRLTRRMMEQVRDRHLVIWFDNDEAGRGHRRFLFEQLADVAKSMRAVDLADHVDDLGEGEDVTDAMEKRGATSQDVKKWAAAAEAIDCLLYGKTADQIVIKPLQILRPGWELGQFVLVFGDPGLGKSTILADFVATVVTGRPLHGESPNARYPVGSVVMVADEDDWSRVVIPRLDVAGADLKRVLMIRGMRIPGEDDFRPLDVNRDLASLERRVRAIGDVRLIVLDPMEAVVGRLDTNDPIDVRIACTKLQRFAERHRLTLVGVKHLRKAKTDNPHLQISGSHVWVAVMRRGWGVRKDPSDPSKLLFLPGKTNLAATGGGYSYQIVGENIEHLFGDDEDELAGFPRETTTARVKWLGDDARDWEKAATESPDQGDHGQQREDMEHLLTSMLAQGPRNASVIEEECKQNGFNWRSMHRLANKIGVVKERKDDGRDWQWRDVCDSQKKNYDDQQKREMQLVNLDTKIKQEQDDVPPEVIEALKKEGGDRT